LHTSQGGDAVRLKYSNVGGDGDGDGDGLQLVAQSDGRVIGQFHNNNLVPVYNNKNTLYRLNEARRNGTATPVGNPENGYQTYKVGDELYVLRVTDTSGLSATDIRNLTAHPESHTLGRHGADVTDEQLLTRAQTGIAPDGSKTSPPNFSSSFNSPQQVVRAQNDIQAQIIREGDNFQVNQDGSRTITISSSEAYGRGLPANAQSFGEMVQMTGIKATLKQHPVTGEWQFVLLTMLIGPTQ